MGVVAEGVLLERMLGYVIRVGYIQMCHLHHTVCSCCWDEELR